MHGRIVDGAVFAVDDDALLMNSLANQVMSSRNRLEIAFDRDEFGLGGVY